MALLTPLPLPAPHCTGGAQGDMAGVLRGMHPGTAGREGERSCPFWQQRAVPLALLSQLAVPYIS